MGLLERAGRYLFPSSSEVAHAVTEMTEAWSKGMMSADQLYRRGLEAQLGTSKVTSPYTQVFAVYVAVSRKSQSAASVPWCLQTRTRTGRRIESEVVEVHPLYDLMSHPNDTMVGCQLFEATYTFLELRGCAFWFLDGIAGREQKAPKRIRLLMGAVKVGKRNAAGDVVTWVETDEEGKKTEYPAERIVPFRYFHPEKADEGLAPLTAAAGSYRLSWSSQVGQNKFYENGMMPPFYVKHTGDTNPTKEDRFVMRKEFDQQYKGLRRWWRVPMMSKGFELASIAVNARDAEWMNTQNLTTKQILAVFGVPPSIAGFTEDANRSITVEERRQFWGGTIRSTSDLVAASIQAHLIEKFWPGLAFAYEWQKKFAEVMPEELREAVKSAHTMISDGVAPVQAYELHGVTLDTTDAPHLEIGWLPMSVAPAHVLMDESMYETPAPEPFDDDDEVPDDDDDDEDKTRTIRRAASNMTRVKYGLERRALGDWRRFLTWFERETLQDIRAASKAKVDETAVKFMRAIVKAAAKAGWTLTAKQVKVELNFSTTDPAVRRILERREQSITDASTTVQKRVRETVSAGLKAGESTPQITSRVRSFFATERVGKARVVAKQETASAFGESRWEVMREAQVWGTVWRTAGDDDVRPTHAAQEGEVRRLDEPFSNGLRFPLDPAGDASETMGCRCDTEPVLVEP
jgi:HK97 family phage portal protein